jgi:hypothetical protein
VNGLLMTGTLVPFRVTDTHIELAPDRENIFVRVEIAIARDDDNEPEDIVEWGAFGFLFTIAALSFADARPRGVSQADFRAKDEFGVDDFLHCLTFGRDGLRFHADYIRGRCLKTEISLRAEGTVTLTTWGRGRSALRWLDALQGKKRMTVVSSGGDGQAQKCDD